MEKSEFDATASDPSDLGIQNKLNNILEREIWTCNKLFS